LFGLFLVFLIFLNYFYFLQVLWASPNTFIFLNSLSDISYSSISLVISYWILYLFW
jgi:hypothetical protein